MSRWMDRGMGKAMLVSVLSIESRPQSVPKALGGSVNAKCIR